MNTKIQVLNSVDLENISGGMEENLENILWYNSFAKPHDSYGCCKESSRNSENLKDFLNGLANPFGFVYTGGKDFVFVGNYHENVTNFSLVFTNKNGIPVSARAGSLTALAIFTGAIIGTYEGIKWAVKKIF